MNDGREPIFVRELNVRIPFETYQDPEREPEYQTKEALALEGLYICERLFWATQHLAYHAGSRALAFDLSKFFETMQTIGLVGRAVAAGVSVEVEALKHIAARAPEGGGA